MLKIRRLQFHLVREGQSLEKIASAYSVSARLLAKENGLCAQPPVGSLLRIPKEYGNAYTVKEGDTKTLLCGSDEAFARKNGTDVFYLGMRVIL